MPLPRRSLVRSVISVMRSVEQENVNGPLVPRAAWGRALRLLPLSLTCKLLLTAVPHTALQILQLDLHFLIVPQGLLALSPTQQGQKGKKGQPLMGLTWLRPVYLYSRPTLVKPDPKQVILSHQSLFIPHSCPQQTPTMPYRSTS